MGRMRRKSRIARQDTAAEASHACERPVLQPEPSAARGSLVRQPGLSAASGQSEIYVGFVDTPGLFASIIRRVIGQNYVHVVLGFDPELKEAYSIGRRNPAVPFFAGFERENREKILKKYPTARYQICRIACTNMQREALLLETKTEWERRFTHHYMIIGLVFLLAGIPFDQKNHDTCSSWLARVTQKVGLQEWDKPFPLITPRDVYEQMGKESGVGTLVFEGMLVELMAGSAARLRDGDNDEVSKKRYADGRTKKLFPGSAYVSGSDGAYPAALL